MPHAALRTCSYPGCSNPVKSGRCNKHPYLDAHDPDSQKLYNTRRWKRIRKAQLAKEPWCDYCLKEGRYISATDCDHIEPHRGNPVKFFKGPFQSLCHFHHSQKTGIEIGWGRGDKKVSSQGATSVWVLSVKKSPQSKLLNK